MMGRPSRSLAPTPAEVAGLIFALYFFAFLGGVSVPKVISHLAKGQLSAALNGVTDAPHGVAGVAAATGGIVAGMVLSRLLALKRGHGPSGEWAWLLVILGLAVAAPFIAEDDFRTSQMAVAAYTAVSLLGLNLLTGYTGQGSIGHSAFMGIGGYGTAILVHEWDVNITLAVIISTLAAALAGLLIGIPALRLSGPYLAIATLGLAVVFTPVMKLEELASITGGRGGINLFTRSFGPPVDWGWLSDARWYYLLTMLSLGVGVLLLSNLLGSAVGRAFRAVRDNELAAAATGVNVPATKLAAFAISSAYAGFAGSFLFIIGNRFVSPDSFSVLMSIELLLAMVIGGMASIPGSLIGAFFLVYVYREGLETVSVDTEQGSDTYLLIVGLLLAAVVLLRNGWVNAQIRRIGPLLHPRLGTLVLSLVRLACVVVLAFVFAWAFRAVTADLQLVTLRGAMAGAFLIMIVLFLPTGLIGFVGMLKELTWRGLLALASSALVAPEGREESEEVQAVATTTQ
jgi:branched-chain amino acid transport system permease protein